MAKKAAMFALCLSAAVGWAGCATDNSADDPADDPAGSDLGLGAGGLNRGEIAVSVRYQRTAEGNWLRGNEAFEDNEFFAAQRYFQYIRTKFPYSRFAAMSEVRIADCLYERERYLEAIDRYQTFVRTHPAHKQVPYAMYRVGTAYYEQIPSDFFMLPPAHEKDQSAVRDTERKLSEYLRRFPKDEYAKPADKKLKEVRKRLMDHERYVANFYRHLERDRAYVGRLEIIRKDFADVGLTDDLLLEIVEVWARLGELEKAKEASAQLTESFPGSDNIEDAKEALAEAEAEAKAKADAEAKAKAEAAANAPEPEAPDIIEEESTDDASADDSDDEDAEPSSDD